MKRQQPKRRNPAAAALAKPQYRKRVINPKTIYNRKVIKQQEHLTCLRDRWF